jgi:hypothetical protein
LSKFCDRLPLYRQADIYARRLSSSSSNKSGMVRALLDLSFTRASTLIDRHSSPTLRWNAAGKDLAPCSATASQK